jgi:hypothetical protein
MPVDADRFVSEIFAGTPGTVVLAATPPAKGKKRGNGMYHMAWCPGFFEKAVPAQRYFCIGTSRVAPEAIGNGASGREAKDIERVAAIVLDDVGTKVPRDRVEGLLPASWWNETSLANFQVGYILDNGADPAEADRLIGAIIAAGLTDAGAGGVNRLVRPPGSINLKRGTLFEARLTAWNPERRYTIDELALGLELSDPSPSPESSSSPRGGSRAPRDPLELEVDPVLAWLDAAGMVLGEASTRGWVPIRCPWEAEHGDHTMDGQPDSGVAYKARQGRQGGAFKCHHGHCRHREWKDVVGWIRQQDASFRLDDTPSLQDATAEIERLSRLDPFAYQRQRVDAAQRLGVPVGFLDKQVRQAQAARAEGENSLPEIEPWSDPVDGGVLLDDISDTLARHIGLPTRAEHAIALWIMHAHCLDAFEISPRLAFTSPVFGCGKTTALAIAGDLCPRVLIAANVTAASTFRAIEKWRPTFMLDEADNVLKDNPELLGVLNSGHRKASAYVIRTVGDDHDARRFTTWCAAGFAIVGALPGGLRSRSIHVEMQRLAKNQTVESYAQHRKPFADLARRASRWAIDNMDRLRDAEPTMPEGFANRRADNWRPLLAIAEALGGQWPTLAREAALTLDPVETDQTISVMLIEDIRTILGESDRIASATLATRLAEMEGRPWPEYGRARKPITTNAIARLLAKFHIQPVGMRDPDTDRPGKGYWAEPLKAVFERYLS